MSLNYELSYRKAVSHGKVTDEGWESEYYELSRKQITAVKKFVKEHNISIDICKVESRDNPDIELFEVYAHNMSGRSSTKLHKYMEETVDTI